MATEAPVQDVDNVIPDIEDSDGPPMPYERDFLTYEGMQDTNLMNCVSNMTEEQHLSVPSEE